MTEKIHTTDDLFKQINDRLAIIGETPDAYFLCQCVETLKQQGQTIDIQAAKIEALEKDAERLAYLDSLATYNGRSFMGGTHHLEFTHDFDSPNSSFYAAIDAAIAGEAT